MSARWRVPLPCGAEPPYRVFVNGVPQRQGSDFDVVGEHIANAGSKYAEADRRLERFGTRLERATDWEETSVEPAAEAHELPRAVDAA